MTWYPYAQMKTMKTPYVVKDADGVYIKTENKELIDSVSSWWCTIHGYSNKEINEVAKEQLDRFAHVMMGGLTHDSVLKLGDKLKEILPGDLNHAFFSDSGSVAVEVALKMAVQFYDNCGKSKKREFVSLRGAYHGDTFKAMQVGDDEDYHKAFPEKDGVYHVAPDIEELEEVFKQKHDKLAAFIVEPLLQGAAGMKMYDVSFLKAARLLCDEYDVLFIFDEVATGFGRTGNMFVSELVLPDIIVLGKALTGGYIGHAATVANEKIYAGFYSDDPSKALMHGPTFMGNALACSISLKSIEIFQRDDYMAKIKNIERILKEELLDFESSKIKETRVMGACGCIEVHNPEDLQGFTEFAYSRGVWNRPFLNFMYTMPPYIITEDELRKIISVFKEWFTR